MRPELKAGEILNDTYRLVELIGKGGMGEVWKAAHMRLPKNVAVKVLLDATLANESALARFRREAEIASRLNHPNIVDILDFNTLPGGVPYMVLELLAGESLRDRLRQGPMGMDDALRVLRQVASALVEAHGKGVVHRDLKPENIHLVPEVSDAGPTERAKVLDFGISKLQGGETALTQESEVLGTPVYMAPEQVSASQGDIDGRTDQFALATIFYEMVTGSVAFGGHSVIQVLGRVLQGEPDPIETLIPEVPANLSNALKKALSKDPGQRFESVTEFVDTMSSALPSGSLYVTGKGVSNSGKGGGSAVAKTEHGLGVGPAVIGEKSEKPAIGMAPTMASGVGPSSFKSESSDENSDIGTQATLYSSSDDLQQPADGEEKDDRGDREVATDSSLEGAARTEERLSVAAEDQGKDRNEQEERSVRKVRDIPPTRPVERVDEPWKSGFHEKRAFWKSPLFLVGGLVFVGVVVFLVFFVFSRSGSKAPAGDDKSPVTQKDVLAKGDSEDAGGVDDQNIEGDGESGSENIHGAGEGGSSIDGKEGEGASREIDEKQDEKGDKKAGASQPGDEEKKQDNKADKNGDGRKDRPRITRKTREGSREPSTDEKDSKKKINPEAKDFLDKARSALAGKRFDEAFRYAERSLGKQETSTAHVIMAKARCGQKRRRDAVGALNRLSGRTKKRTIEWCKRHYDMDL